VEHTGGVTERDSATAGGPGGGRVAADDPGGRVEVREAELGGDPACWLNLVCQDCGRFIDDPLAETCPACGAPRESPR